MSAETKVAELRAIALYLRGRADAPGGSALAVEHAAEVAGAVLAPDLAFALTSARDAYAAYALGAGDLPTGRLQREKAIAIDHLLSLLRENR